jgi:dephospho-CoA kinase
MNKEQFIAHIAGMNRKAWFNAVLGNYNRIAIVGGPRAGKTTLSRLTDRPVIHTDDYRDRSWEAVPHAVIADVLDLQGDRFIVEGVQVARALRKGLEVDVVLVLNEPLSELTPRQEGMRKGVMTVLADYYKDHKDVPILQAPAVTDLEKNEADDDSDQANA